MNISLETPKDVPYYYDLEANEALIALTSSEDRPSKIFFLPKPIDLLGRQPRFH
jgi:hypothetical protein